MADVPGDLAGLTVQPWDDHPAVGAGTGWPKIDICWDQDGCF